MSRSVRQKSAKPRREDERRRSGIVVGEDYYDCFRAKKKKEEKKHSPSLSFLFLLIFCFHKIKIAASGSLSSSFSGLFELVSERNEASKKKRKAHESEKSS